MVAARSVIGHLPRSSTVVICSVVLGVVYAVGPRWRAVATSPRVAGGWLGLLLVAWTGLLVLTPDAVYLAFPWSFLVLHLLPRPVGLAAVAFTTVVGIAGFAWHQRTFTAAMAIGPTLGAAVAVASVLAYEAVHAESERRGHLLLELESTRAELAEAQHRAGVLDERERLAREIHDTLAQGLTSIQLLLRAADTSLTPGRAHDPRRASSLVGQARRAAQENLDEARRFVRALAPADLDASSLATALKRLCDTTTERSGIEVRFHEVGRGPQLATPVEVALLRIAQGALANVVQHARATRADVTLTGMDAAVTLDIVDDGIGFDADAPPTSPSHAGEGSADQGGFGLHSMMSRATDLGGMLSVESHPGRGTAVSVQFYGPRGSSASVAAASPLVGRER